MSKPAVQAKPEGANKALSKKPLAASSASNIQTDKPEPQSGDKKAFTVLYLTRSGKKRSNKRGWAGAAAPSSALS